MKYLIILIFLLNSLNTFSQNNEKRKILFDTTEKTSFNSINFYRNTDFDNFKDPVNWLYEIQLYDESIKKNNNNLSLGIIKLKKYFNLTINDSKRELTEFNFDIYNISDSLYCQNEAKKIKMLSSCIPPNVGGDYIEIGNFILLNRNVCLQCEDIFNVDFCRPEINQILLIMKSKEIEKIDDFEQSLQFALGVIEKKYWQKYK